MARQRDRAVPKRDWAPGMPIRFTVDLPADLAVGFMAECKKRDREMIYMVRIMVRQCLASVAQQPAIPGEPAESVQYFPDGTLAQDAQSTG